MDERLLSREGQIELMRKNGVLVESEQKNKKSGDEQRVDKESKEKEEEKDKSKGKAQEIRFDKETGIPICDDCGKPITDASNCPNCIHNGYRDEDPFGTNSR